MNEGDIVLVKDKEVLILQKIAGGKSKIRFLGTGYEKIVYTGNLKKGEVKDPTEPTIYGVACIGDGPYNSKHPAYKAWMNMLARCYSEAGQGKSGADVCDEWKNFQNFASWWGSTKIIDFELDKDLSGKNIYGPDTCFWLPKELNQYLNTTKGSRTDLPIGVSHRQVEGSYEVRCPNLAGSREFLGLFTDVGQAFQAYKNRKEMYFKLFADKYKNVLPAKAYELLYSLSIDEQGNLYHA